MVDYTSVLDHAITHKLNVMFTGLHGVGKTAIVKEIFNKRYGPQGEAWLYYSASTMEPWVDMIGVPKERTTEDGQTVLTLIRPEAWILKNIRAVFFDEFNRAPKKIRNAVMELTQFGSINGHKFPHLEVVWAARNPDQTGDDSIVFDVEPLDPAQLDRFHYHIDVAYKPDAKYFRQKYGSLGELAVKWWGDASKETQADITPRRLDYALQEVLNKGDIRYVLHSRRVNVADFTSYISKGDPDEQLKKLIVAGDDEKRKFFKDNNSLHHVYSVLVDNKAYLDALAQFLPEEEILSNIKMGKKKTKLAVYITDNPDKFRHMVDSVLANRTVYRREIVAAFDRFKKEQEAKGVYAATPTKSSGQKVTFLGSVVDADTLTFCVTGTLDKSRTEIEAYIKSLGIGYSLAVTASVTHLVMGDNPGSAKVKSAEDKGVPVLKKDEFYAIRPVNKAGAQSK